MRHKKKFNHLGRNRSHRHAMLSNMSTSLIMHKRIFTTVAKAKALQQFIDPMITKATKVAESSEQATNNRRQVFQKLQNKEAVTELFVNVSQKVGDRPGGYTRIIRTGARLGDNASMCFIELVDYNENMVKEGKKAAKTTTRRSRAKKTADVATADTKETTATKAAPKKEAKADAPAKKETAKKAAPKAEEKKAPAAKKEAKTEDKPEEEK